MTPHAEIENRGEIVHSLFWDSGGPGAGADYELIYKYRGRYWSKSTSDGWAGPFDTLDEALTESFLCVTSAVESITNTELTGEELAQRLDVDSVEPGHMITLNDERWEITADGRLSRVI